MITLPTLTSRQRTDREFAALLLLPTVDGANTLWNRLAPRQYVNLLSSVPGTPTSPPAGRFWWDPALAQYHLSRHGSIPAGAIRGALNTFNGALAGELATMASAAATGQVPPFQWHNAMRQAIKDAQVVNAAVGRGGIPSLQDSDFAAIGETVAFQEQRLEFFANDMEAGAVKASSAGWRAAAYAKSAISTYHGMRTEAGKAAGYTLERNILGSAEHCYWNSDKPQPRPDCPSLSHLGWISIGQMPLIGSRLCLWNCHCHIQFGG
jgi:hypothetical protein